MDRERQVAEHYGHGSLEQAILTALTAAGKDADRLTTEDLAPVDEFHIGGRQATVDFADQLPLKPGMSLLDIGSGLGGPSRYFAQARGCRVTGIDLTEEYVATATALARRVGLADRVSYRQGSALALPFEAESFDGAYMIHVGMNIEDKAALFAGIGRVLKPGGFFGIFDVMRAGPGELGFPVPWASSPETSFIETAATYRRLLEAAGFTVSHERDRRDFAGTFFAQMRARGAQVAPSLGLQVVMGETARPKVANMIGNLERGLITPVEIVGRLG